MAGVSDMMTRFDKLVMDQRGAPVLNPVINAQLIFRASEIMAEAERSGEMWKDAYTSRSNEIAALRKELAELKQVKVEVCTVVSFVLATG
jgi:hypothetical protein